MAKTSDKKSDDVFETTRMSLGAHLDELRSRLIKALYGYGIAVAICFIFREEIISFVAQPLLWTLKANGLNTNLYATHVAELFYTVFKICLIAGLFLSAPWVFWHLWGFIAAGLYPREKRFVHLFMPGSIVLFMIGGLFFVFIAAPICFNFFIEFTVNFDKPELDDQNTFSKFMSQILSKEHIETSDAETPSPMAEDAQENMIELIPKIDQYVSLVMILGLGFGLSFQMPLVVFFLGRVGIVNVPALQGKRKYVLLGVFVFSAIITPPDPLSMIAMSVPMYVLYEVGIVMLRLWPGAASVPRG
jgi:sec-independent protein translocase protein TatC